MKEETSRRESGVSLSSLSGCLFARDGKPQMHENYNCIIKVMAERKKTDRHTDTEVRGTKYRVLRKTLRFKPDVRKSTAHLI